MDVIRDLPLPTTDRKLREFLGVVNYYHCFVLHATAALAPLHDIVRGYKRGLQKKLAWTEDATSAFEHIKQKLSDTSLLAYPQPHEPTSIYTDASVEAIGAVLQQQMAGDTLEEV